MRPVFLVFAALTLSQIASTSTPTAAAAEKNDRPPNIIFIIADDMHRHMFNCLPEGRHRRKNGHWGKAKNLTPAIDRLAAEGTLMLGQYVSAPVCTPSRYSCLTGLYASRSKSPNFTGVTKREGQSVVQWTSFITDEETLSRRLKKAGYVTGLVGKNHVIKGDIEKVGYGEDPNDPKVSERLKIRQQQAEKLIRRGGFDHVSKLYYENPDHNGPRELAVHNMDWTTDGALDFIDHQKDKPFFLYYATTTPHGPGEPDRSWNADPRIIPTGYLTKNLDVLPPRDSIPRRIIEAGLRPDSARCNLLWLDDSVSAILSRLEKHGIDNNTIIVFFNDHGQAAKGTLYQGGVSSPSIIWRKGGFANGSVNDSAVSNIDFAPTLLDFAGVEYEANDFDGRSFAPLLQAESNQHAGQDSMYFEMGYTRAVTKNGWKYLALRYPERAQSMTKPQRQKILDRFNEDQRVRGRPIYTRDPMTPFSHISLIPGGGDAEAMSTGKRPGYYDADQLYDLTADPEEQHNLASDQQHAEKLAAMKAELQIHFADLPGGFAELKPSPTTEPVPTTKLAIDQSSHVVTADDMHDYSYQENEFVVHTNLWGAHAMKDDVPEFRFELFRNSAAALKLPSYQWDIEEPFLKPIFPFVGYGDRMWKKMRTSTTIRLPLKLKDLGSCDLYYKLNIDEKSFRKAKGNLAVDVWLGDQATGNDDSMRTEIMLWFDRNDQYPVGAKNHEGTYSFGGATWDLYIGELSDGGTTVNTFIAQQPIYEGTIDFMVPLEIVKAKGRIGESSYLGGFELGNEIYQGQGITDIEQFHVDVRTKGYPSGNSHNWLFHNEPISKHRFNGKKGFDTGVINDSETMSRTVATRFLVDDLRRRQVIYKEGGVKSGLSIYADAGKVHVANWNTIDGELKHSLISTPLDPQADSNDKNPDSYVVVVASGDHDNKQLTAFINGKKMGNKPYHGLAANRGTTTLGYSDAAIWYATGVSNNPTTMAGVLDDVMVFDRTLTPDEISSIK